MAHNPDISPVQPTIRIRRRSARAFPPGFQNLPHLRFALSRRGLAIPDLLLL